MSDGKIDAETFQMTPLANGRINGSQPHGATLLTQDAARLLRQGIAAANNGDRTTARAALQQVTALEPANESAWLWLASIAEQPAERLQFLDTVLTLNPQNSYAQSWHKVAQKNLVTYLMQQGAKAAEAGDRPLALKLLLQAIDHQPENEMAWLWLASVADTLEDKMAYLHKVIEINPANERARELFESARRRLTRKLLQRGLEAAIAGNREEARTLIDDVLERNAQLDDAWVLKAYVADGIEEKIRCFERALEINPENTRAQTGLQKVRAKLKGATPAWACLVCRAEAAQQPDPCPQCGALQTLNAPARLLNNPAARHELIKPALPRLMTQIKAQPGFDAYYQLALALLNLGNSEQGLVCLREAARLRPADENLRAAIIALKTSPPASGDSVAANAPDLPQTTSATPTAHSILVVDDSATVRKLVTLKLEDHGLRVATAADGLEALARLNDETPDLILLDVSMPRLDGYQFCKLVKKNAHFKHIPIIMLTSKDGLFNRMRGRITGADVYLTKPFEPEELLGLIAKHCAPKTAG